LLTSTMASGSAGPGVLRSNCVPTLVSRRGH
jgi:hypothetical protein